MKTKILLTVLVMSLLAACNKDKYQTKPRLSFKKVNTDVLQQRQALTFTLEVTDAEGDVQDSIYVQKIVAQCPNSNFSERYAMPKFTATKNLKADIDITYAYNNNDLGYPSLKGPQCSRNDTAIFRFFIKDKAKNVSDTISSGTVVIVR